MNTSDFKVSESIGALQLPATPKIHLYTADDPSGYKVSILLEELVLAYPELAKGPLSYDFKQLNLRKNEQKSPEYLKINPNGRIPALVDDNAGGHAVFETASIMLWLVDNYDKEFKLWFPDRLLQSEAMSWIMWTISGLIANASTARYFSKLAPEQTPYAIERYHNETIRLFGVLEEALARGKGEWILGDKYSIVDINAFSWVRKHDAYDIDISPFPRIAEWLERIENRPGVYAGLGVPARQ